MQNILSSFLHRDEIECRSCGLNSRNGGMAEWWMEWRNGGMAEWQNGGMVMEWRNGGMAELRNGNGMGEWRNGGMAYSSAS